MNDPEVKIAFTGDAAGAVAAAQAATAAIHDTTKAVTAGSAATAEQKGRITALEGAIKALDLVVPGTGELLTEALGGPIGIALALAGAIKMVIDKINDYSAELDKVTAAELQDHQQTIVNLQKSWADATAETAKYYAAIDTAGTNGDPIKKQIDNAKQLADAESEASKKIIESMGQVTLARLKASGAGPEQIDKAKAAIKMQLEQLDADKDAGTVSALQAELAQRTAAQPGLDATRDATAADALDKEDKARRANLALTKAQAAIAPGSDLQKQLDTAAANNANAQSAPDMQPMPNPTGGPAVEIDNRPGKVAAASALKEAQNKIDQQNKLIATLKQQVITLDYEADKAERLATKAKEAGEANADRTAELPGEITQTKAVGTARAAGDISQMAATQITLDDQANTLEETLNAIVNSGGVQRRIVEVMKSIPDHHNALYVEMLAVQTQMRDEIIRLKEKVNSTGFNSR
jgi:hypothetical protein